MFHHDFCFCPQGLIGFKRDRIQWIRNKSQCLKVNENDLYKKKKHVHYHVIMISLPHEISSSSLIKHAALAQQIMLNVCNAENQYNDFILRIKNDLIHKPADVFKTRSLGSYDSVARLMMLFFYWIHYHAQWALIKL